MADKESIAGIKQILDVLTSIAEAQPRRIQPRAARMVDDAPVNNERQTSEALSGLNALHYYNPETLICGAAGQQLHIGHVNVSSCEELYIRSRTH